MTTSEILYERLNITKTELREILKEYTESGCDYISESQTQDSGLFGLACEDCNMCAIYDMIVTQSMKNGD